MKKTLFNKPVGRVRSKVGITRKASKKSGHGTWASFGKVGKMRKK